MFWAFKLSFDADFLAFFGWVTVLATFPKIWATFSDLLVTLLSRDEQTIRRITLSDFRSYFLLRTRINPASNSDPTFRGKSLKDP
jgi:hypothetical protein